MKDINLLPKYYLDNQELHRFIVKKIANMAIIFLLLILIVIIINVTICVEQQMVSHYQSLLENSKYLQSENIAKQLKHNEEIQGRMDEIFADINKGTTIGVNYVDVVVHAMTEGMYATEMTLATVDGSIIFSGTSESKQDIAEFISKLDQIKVFSDIEIIKVSNTNQNRVAFTIKLQVNDVEQ